MFWRPQSSNLLFKRHLLYCTYLFRSDRPDENDPELGDGPLPENDENTHDYGNERRPIKTNEMICRNYYELRNQRDAYE